MGFYDKHILPHIINVACSTKPVLKQREKVVPNAKGTVLEVGMGTGINLPYYDAAKIERVIGLDPSTSSFKMAKKRALEVTFPVEFLGLKGEDIPLDDASVDTVLLTFTLCTIPQPDRALAQMRRVLKPGGQLVFCEHGRAPDASVRRWQDRLNGIWRALGGGCNLNRDIPALISDSGFRIDSQSTMYLPRTPKFSGYVYWGAAAVH